MDERRPRRVEQVRLPPGPLAELKALLYELYTAAGEPPLTEIAAWVKEDDGLDGSPGRDTIHRLLREAQVPSSQADVVAVVTVLARVARWDPRHAADRVRDLWFAARAAQPLGTPLAEVTDPFSLEVHKPIQLTDHHTNGDPALPVYIPRAHDARLAEVVDRVLAGQSVIAVLIAGSSAGKTRACWEALRPLRNAGGWRLWHPYHPSRVEAALAKLDEVGPRTVVWLNETQNYLGGPNGERVAAGLRSLLTDPARGPVLVLGTLWPGHYTDLTRDTGSQVRHVLANMGAVIEVPYTFTGTDLTTLHRAAAHDPRLAWAADHARDGQITQYLAGAPELLQRLHTASAGTKALILAAMDARRMGHRNALPLALLDQAAPAYLTDTQWHQLGDDWLEQALAGATRLCKGAPGPLAPMSPEGPRRVRSPRAEAHEPCYQLADYLDQHGRAVRADEIPGIEFWVAAAAHAYPADLFAIGLAAYSRGLLRDAAQLYKNATQRGDQNAAVHLVQHLHGLHPTDPQPAHWAAIHVSLGNLHVVARLVENLHRMTFLDEVVVLAERAVVHADLDDPHGVAQLLEALQEAGASDQVIGLMARDPASQVSLNDPSGVARLLTMLGDIGVTDQATGLLARDPASQVSLDAPHAVAHLLEALRKAGAANQVAQLAERAVVNADLDDPLGLGRLLRVLRKTGATDQVYGLLARDPAANVGLNDPFRVAWLLGALWEAGATDQVARLLARDPAAHVSLDDPAAVAGLLVALRRAGVTDQVARLLARDPAAHVSLDDPAAVAGLLVALRKAAAANQIARLAERAAEHADLDVPAAVAGLLDELRRAGATDQVARLLARDPAANVSLDDPAAVARLLSTLKVVGARDQIAGLLARDPAAEVSLNDPAAVARLLVGCGRRGRLTMLPGCWRAIPPPRSVSTTRPRWRDCWWDCGRRGRLTRSPGCWRAIPPPTSASMTRAGWRGCAGR